MKRNIFNAKIIPIIAIIIVALCGGSMMKNLSSPPADIDTQLTAPTPGISPPVETVEPTAEPTPEITPEPTPEPEYFTLTFVGDCTFASVPAYVGTPQGYDTVIKNEGFAYPFAQTLSYFTDDDFTFTNLECTLTDNAKPRTDKTFTCVGKPELVNILVEGDVEFVTLANNHVLDCGEQGYADTKAALDGVGIGYAGRDEFAIYETESGLKIGVYGVSFGTVQQIKDGIAALKELGAEFIIAALHWGDEGSYQVNKDQITQGRAAIDAGADFVYGSHPHTLQPFEEYNGKYIYYSFGNWSFGGNTNPRDKDTFILRMTVERTAEGVVSVIEREHIPCASSGVVNGNNYQPVPYEEGSEEYDRTLSKIDGTFTGQNLSIGYEYGPNE